MKEEIKRLYKPKVVEDSKEKVSSCYTHEFPETDGTNKTCADSDQMEVQC